jgi:ABC-type iron transport system FetAB permease component
MCPVQNAVIGMILGASLVGLTLVGLRLGHGGRRGAAVKLALGALIGGVAAAVAVAIRADLVPDSIEVTVSAVLFAGVAGFAAFLIFRHRGE